MHKFSMSTQNTLYILELLFLLLAKERIELFQLKSQIWKNLCNFIRHLDTVQPEHKEWSI